MYGDWCTHASIACEFTSYQKLNKCQCDILRFLGEKGSHSIYDLAKMLKYRYPYVHKNTKELEKRQLIGFRKVSTGDRLKKLVEIDFKGMSVFLLAWKDYANEAERSIRQAIVKHPQLFPFSKQLDEIEKIIEKQILQKELIRTTWDITNGKKVEIEIDHLALKFPAFIYSFNGMYFSPPKTDFRGKERNQKFMDFLISQDELKKAYISFLAIQDILDLEEGSLEISELAKFRSERELASFEERDISIDSLFPKERLKEVFPEYAQMKHVFTGSLMNRLLWKTIEKPTLEQKKGFHANFPWQTDQQKS